MSICKMENAQFRQMQDKDLQEVIQLEQQISSAPWSEKSFRNAMLSPDNCYLVAACGDKIVGYCGFWCSCDCADLCNLAVAKEFRKQHLGRELLCRGLTLLKEKGIERVLLEVRQSNEAAIGLYTKIGFEKIGVRPNYYSLPVEDGILMEKGI